jgi:CBS domain-containing protein
MKIEDMIGSKPPPVTIYSHKTVQEAMRKLIENKIGSLVVINEEGQPLGIITERDIFHLAYRFRGDMMDMKVGTNMTCKLILGKPDYDVDHAARLLTDNRIRHLPIVDDNNKLCGIISVGDIVRARAEGLLPAESELER